MKSLLQPAERWCCVILMVLSDALFHSILYGLRFGARGIRHHLSAHLNDEGLGIIKSMPTEVYVGAAIKESGHPLHQEIFTKSYLSMDV